jgi:hypothetical protein
MYCLLAPTCGSTWLYMSVYVLPAGPHLRLHLAVHGAAAAAAEHLEVCRRAGVGMAGALRAAGGQAQVAAGVAGNLRQWQWR